MPKRAVRATLTSLPFPITLLIACSVVSSCGDSSSGLQPPPITPNAEFFVYDSTRIPEIPSDWRLRVTGAVEHPGEFSLDDLRALPARRVMATLTCGWYTFASTVDLFGNANWDGVPLQTFFDQVRPTAQAAFVVFRAVDGYEYRFLVSDILTVTDAMLAYEMNGQTLPVEQGYPVRLVIPGEAGLEWVQWIETIEFSTERTGKKLWPVPVHATILDPAHGAALPKGADYRIFGFTLSGNSREVVRVEVSTDGGLTWGDAELLNPFIPNVWKQWEFIWSPKVPGEYPIQARAYDAQGNVQAADDRFYGWNREPKTIVTVY